jgi:hypothetical protein
VVITIAGILPLTIETGILGLGRGVMSFVSQLASTSGSKSFSHCFTPLGNDHNNSSRISFGNSIEVLGDVVSTPLISKDTQPSFYFVTLKGISVGDKYLPYDSSSTIFEGNMFLDSGTLIMYICATRFSQPLDNRSEAANSVGSNCGRRRFDVASLL